VPLGLLDAVEVPHGGAVMTLTSNGGLPWDARSVRLGKGLAWMALHTGAPIVPALSSSSA
jgi:hypothetical protein